MKKKVLIAGAAGALLFGAAAIAQQAPDYDNQSATTAQSDATAADEAAVDTAGTEMDRAGERG